MVSNLIRLMTSFLWPLLKLVANSLLWVSLFFLPLGIVTAFMVRLRRSYDAEADEPFTELPLRPPGESTRVKAEDLFEEAMGYFLALILTSVVSGQAVAMSQPPQRTSIALLAGIFLLVVAGVTAPRILRLLRQSWNYRLGFKGERLVGEEMNQLLAHGYRVFHDVPFDGFNIDHVAVGPAGVFVVETKTRRKWKKKTLQHPAHMVYFDGQFLTWPSGKQDRFGLDQAERNEQTVSDWLTEATGERVTGNPVLTLPGWWVERTKKEVSKVFVASTKGLHSYFPTTSLNPISPEQLRRILYQLSERCRMAKSSPGRTPRKPT